MSDDTSEVHPTELPDSDWTIEGYWTHLGEGPDSGEYTDLGEYVTDYEIGGADRIVMSYYDEDTGSREYVTIGGAEDYEGIEDLVEMYEGMYG